MTDAKDELLELTLTGLLTEADAVDRERSNYASSNAEYWVCLEPVQARRLVAEVRRLQTAVHEQWPPRKDPGFKGGCGA